jgi:hypothetical protein
MLTKVLPHVGFQILKRLLEIEWLLGKCFFFLLNVKNTKKGHAMIFAFSSI